MQFLGLLSEHDAHFVEKRRIVFLAGEQFGLAVVRRGNRNTENSLDEFHSIRIAQRFAGIRRQPSGNLKRNGIFEQLGNRPVPAGQWPAAV